jgi:hypothetical protein
MHYLNALRDRGGAWAVIRAVVATHRRRGVTLLGRCDEDRLAWDLFWAVHRLIREGKLEVSRLQPDAARK